MNIFKTFDCPYKCARILDDKRVVKMAVESAQILSTAMQINNLGPYPYKPTHINHPCVKWASHSYKNYEWVLIHFSELLKEYTNRFEKIHKCTNYIDMLDSPLSNNKNFKFYDLTEHVNCTNFKDIPDVNLAYRFALLEKWKTDKRPPRWFKIERNEIFKMSLLHI